MDDGGTLAHSDPLSVTVDRFVAPPFIAGEILRQVDLAGVRHKLSLIIDTEIIPRLVARHGSAAIEAEDGRHASETEIAELARLVLKPDVTLSTDFVEALREAGLSTERLFVELLEPAARHLGRMWDEDKCDFVEVTLGVGRLQQMLAVFNCSVSVPAFSEKRRVCMISMADEPHSFGVTMVEKFLWAGGWTVQAEHGLTLHQMASLVSDAWFAVVGLTASSDRHLVRLPEAIAEIRRRSRNPCVGIMVGGPPFAARPELAVKVGADATAPNAPSAVLLAQKLFDIGARENWNGSFDRQR